MKKTIHTPLTKEVASSLVAGESLLITGTIYTGRDAAHKRMVETLARGEKLPFDVENAILYYVGPTPAKEGNPIGSAGPTTSYRMDAYAPTLLNLGLRGMIGKGQRNEAVVHAMVENQSVYFAAIGGAGAYLAKCIKKAEVIAYEDLGAEAVRRLEVENFPVIVSIDSRGNHATAEE